MLDRSIISAAAGMYTPFFHSDALQRVVMHHTGSILRAYNYDIIDAIMRYFVHVSRALTYNLVDVSLNNTLHVSIEHNYLDKNSIFYHAGLFYKLLELLSEYEDIKLTVTPVVSYVTEAPTAHVVRIDLPFSIAEYLYDPD